MSDLKFRVRAHSENPTKTIVKARKFELVLDEPEELGGTNQGANPVEFILAAYCGCLNVMAHTVAKEMDFELRSVKINMVGNLNPDRLFGKSFEDRAGYKSIEVTIEPDCDAKEEVLQEWMAAMKNRCPVSDNIENTTPVTFSLK